MALQPDSKLAEIVAKARTASTENNPFTSPEAALVVPDAAARERLGAASVGFLHGLADLVEAYPGAVPNLAAGAQQLSGMLSDLGALIEYAGRADERAITL